jgi:hypothetical protein
LLVISVSCKKAAQEDTARTVVQNSMVRGIPGKWRLSIVLKTMFVAQWMVSRYMWVRR